MAYAACFSFLEFEGSGITITVGFFVKFSCVDRSFRGTRQFEEAWMQKALGFGTVCTRFTVGV